MTFNTKYEVGEKVFVYYGNRLNYWEISSIQIQTFLYNSSEVSIWYGFKEDSVFAHTYNNHIHERWVFKTKDDFLKHIENQC